MATKNLVRTLLEGGRLEAHKQYKKSLKRSERQRVRNACRSARYAYESDVDECDVVVSAARMSWRHCSAKHDAWNASSVLNAWLAKQHGRCWDSVWSDLNHMVDSRTKQGWFVLCNDRFGVLYRVTFGYPESGYDDSVFDRFVVDMTGVFRDLEYESDIDPRVEQVSLKCGAGSYYELKMYARGRYIEECDGELWWVDIDGNPWTDGDTPRDWWYMESRLTMHQQMLYRELTAREKSRLSYSEFLASDAESREFWEECAQRRRRYRRLRETGDVTVSYWKWVSPQSFADFF